MIYVFCDEDIKEDGSDLLYRYAAVAFSQRRFNDGGFHRIKALRESGRSLLNPINETLRATGGFALVSEARIAEKTVPTGVVWGTADIPAMLLRDFAWSLSMILTVADLIPRLLRWVLDFKTADILYDPKSLKPRHRTAVEKFLQSKLKQHIAEWLRNEDIRRRVKVRRVTAVSKPKPGEVPDKFQMGTWIADRIVRRYDRIPNIAGESLIKTTDLTQHVNDTLNDFGKKASSSADILDKNRP
jgi:hypothetical protein